MNRKVNKKERHSQKPLLGISLLYVVSQIRKQIPYFIKTKKAGDPRLQRSGMTTSFGFTLIELLVVVLIIGILAAVALPQYQKAVAKSRFVQLKVLAQSLAEAEEVYYLSNNTYTADYENLDVSFLPEEVSCLNNKQYCTYKFSWGFCALSQSSKYVECGLQKNGHNIITYQVNFNHNNWALDKQMCVSYQLTATSLATKICQNETGQNTFTIEGEHDYAIWYY